MSGFQWAILPIKTVVYIGFGQILREIPVFGVQNPNFLKICALCLCVEKQG